MDVASYCYCEKGLRTNARSLSIFSSFSTAELNNIESEDDNFSQEILCKEIDFWGCDDEYI